MTEAMKKVLIINVEGIGKVYAEKLAALGIQTTKDLLEKGKTPSGREELVKKTGISAKLILEWVRDSDFMRIKGVSEEYSDLLDESGVKDVVDLATKNPEELHKKILEACSRKKITRKPPYLKTVQKWIEQAKKLPKVIQY